MIPKLQCAKESPSELVQNEDSEAHPREPSLGEVPGVYIFEAPTANSGASGLSGPPNEETLA